MNNFKKLIIICLIFYSAGIEAEMINRYGTTTANFLEIGIGGANAMGEAFVADADDLSSIYWNPAGLSNLSQNSAYFTIQPWVANIDMVFASGAISIPGVGILGLGITQLDYGDEKVTTLEYQNGTGEYFTASDFAASLTFARKIVSWFGFGSSFKYISSNIWHSSASAFAVDLGVQVDTDFFSRTGRTEDGLKIGMSISNYGTRMKFDGIDTYQPIDISEYEEGNYGDVSGQFRTSKWELPLIFRIGVSVKPIVTNFFNLTLNVDALHPNNNSESINVGTELENKLPGFGTFIIRLGVKSLYVDRSGAEALYGTSDIGKRLTMGIGLKRNYLGNKIISFDYSYKSLGILGNVQAFSIGLSF